MKRKKLSACVRAYLLHPHHSNTDEENQTESNIKKKNVIAVLLHLKMQLKKKLKIRLFFKDPPKLAQMLEKSICIDSNSYYCTYYCSQRSGMVAHSIE